MVSEAIEDMTDAEFAEFMQALSNISWTEIITVFIFAAIVTLIIFKLIRK